MNLAYASTQSGDAQASLVRGPVEFATEDLLDHLPLHCWLTFTLVGAVLFAVLRPDCIGFALALASVNVAQALWIASGLQWARQVVVTVVEGAGRFELRRRWLLWPSRATVHAAADLAGLRVEEVACESGAEYVAMGHLSCGASFRLGPQALSRREAETSIEAFVAALGHRPSSATRADGFSDSVAPCGENAAVAKPPSQ